MGELDEVAACSDAAVAGDERDYVVVDEGLKEFDCVWVNSAAALHEAAEACYHCCFDVEVGEWVSHSGGVASDDVVLEFFKVFVVHSPLCHWAESGVYAVDDLVVCECAEKVMAAGDVFEVVCRDDKFLIMEDDAFYVFEGELHLSAYLLNFVSVVVFESGGECSGGESSVIVDVLHCDFSGVV